MTDWTRDDLADALANVVLDTHDLDVRSIDYGNALADWLEQHPEALAAFMPKVRDAALAEAAEVADQCDAKKFREKYRADYGRKMYQPFRVEAAINGALNIQAEDARDAILALRTTPPPAPVTVAEAARVLLDGGNDEDLGPYDAALEYGEQQGGSFAWKFLSALRALVDTGEAGQ